MCGHGVQPVLPASLYVLGGQAWQKSLAAST
jgi:hypothetical protein